jgi:hypothetical protein
MLIVTIPELIVAPPVAADNVTVNVLVASFTLSLMIGTVSVFATASPLAQESVPDVEVKSEPPLAEPLAVA